MLSARVFFPGCVCPGRPTLWRKFPVPVAHGLTFPPPDRRCLNSETPPFGSLACRNFDHCREHCPDNARAGDPGVRRQQLCAEPADRGATPPADQQPDPVAAERRADADQYSKAPTASRFLIADPTTPPDTAHHPPAEPRTGPP